MKMKNFWKRFWTMNVHNHEGFTLVELIIVIAILAILSSVAVVGYSSYITKANKQADMTLVSEVANALQLYYYSNMDDFSGLSAVILTSNGPQIGNTDTFATAAMDAAFGAGNWGSLKLKYTEWGNGAAATQRALTSLMNATKNDAAIKDLMSGDPNKWPSFIDNVDELFEEVKDTSIWAAEILGEKVEGGADLVGKAAVATLGNYTSADAFAADWIAGESFSNDKFAKSEGLDATMAAAAAVKARNTAMASFLQANGFAQYYDVLANYSLENSNLPEDAGSQIHNDEDAFIALLEKVDPDNAVVATALLLDAYFVGPAQLGYNDAVAYYTMMSTVEGVSEDAPASDDEYWDDMSDAVSAVVGIIRGESSLDAMNGVYNNSNVTISDNTIVIMLTSDGNALVNGKPLDEFMNK